jgi:hypothetical protein
MYIGFWWTQKEKDNYENLDIGWWVILKWILERQDGVASTGLI